MFKRHTHLAVAALALAGGVAIGQATTSDTDPQRPQAQPARPVPVTQPIPEDICAGDEQPVRYGPETILCFHTKGDGWRVAD